MTHAFAPPDAEEAISVLPGVGSVAEVGPVDANSFYNEVHSFPARRPCFH